MFRRILTFVAASVAAMSLVACQDDSKPTIEFERILYTVYQKGSVDVALTISEPASSALTVPLIFSGNAEKGTDYEVSAESITIAPGETSGTVTVRDKGLNEEKQISLGFTAPVGFKAGARSQTVVSVDPKEVIVYSFETTKGDAVGAYYLKINVKGAVSGDNLHLSEDLSIPLKITGDAVSNIAFEDGKAPHAVLKPGKTIATARFSLKDGFTTGSKVTIAVDTEAEPRFTPGDNEKLELTLYKVEVPDALLGTWVFDRVFDVDDLKEFFSGEEDDIKLLPLNNTGLKLTFSKEADGSVTLTPSGSGDFLNFFRKATVTPANPVNYSPQGVVSGKNTVSECTMFMNFEGYDVHTNMYYSLSSANRAFSATEEQLGSSTIVFTIVDEGLAVEFRDYDKPPFGENWWSTNKFDADMFSFASLFVKQ